MAIQACLPAFYNRVAIDTARPLATEPCNSSPGGASGIQCCEPQQTPADAVA